MTFASWTVAIPAALSLAFAATVAEGRPPRPAPPLAPASGQIVSVDNMSELQTAVRNLTSNTTIVVAPGTYVLTSTLSIRGPLSNVGIRGATTNADDVVIVGRGMREVAYGSVPFGVWVGEGVNGVTIANLTIRDFFFHSIILNAGTQRPHLYNLRLIDAGQQFVKANPDRMGVGVSDGVLEYSIIEFTDKAKDDYPKGIDIHGGANWIIRHNLFRNIVAPDGKIAGPGVLVWRGSRNTLTEGNTFINCARGIMYGADDRVSPSHSGGIIRNNMFFRASHEPGDVGIILSSSPDTRVLNNTIIVSGTYRASIEYRYAGTTRALIANNLVDGAIQSRDGGTATLTRNYTNAVPGMFVNGAAGDLHLAESAVGLIDQAATMPDVTDDWDGQPRAAQSLSDIGADERVPESDVQYQVTESRRRSWKMPERVFIRYACHRAPAHQRSTTSCSSAR